MVDRNKLVNENFVNFVETENFPKADNKLTPIEAGLSASDVIDIFESQVLLVRCFSIFYH